MAKDDGPIIRTYTYVKQSITSAQDQRTLLESIELLRFRFILLFYSTFFLSTTNFSVFHDMYDLLGKFVHI